MTSQMIRDLLRRIGGLERRAMQHHTGLVTAVAPLSVALGGSSTSYTAVSQLEGGLAVGDKVSVVAFGYDLLVLGRIAPLDPLHVIGGSGEPGFAGAWVNYDSRVAAFYRRGERIYLQGVVKSGTVGSAIFTLPLGYRPAHTHIFPVVANDLFGAVHVAETGAVTHYLGSNVYVDLAPINFRVA